MPDSDRHTVPMTIEIGDGVLRCAQIAQVASGAGDVHLAPAGRERAARSAAFADRVAGTRLLYGRSTGVGANRTVALPAHSPGRADVDSENGEVGINSGALVADDPVLRLLRSHATAAGPLRSAARVRAMLCIRLNQLAQGGSGVRPLILDALLQLLRAGALPPVRELGSIGTGDLSALATVALVLCGDLAPRSVGPSAADVAATPAIPAIRFRAGDGLAFISSNAATLGDAALAVQDLAGLAAAVLPVAALTFTGLRGNAEAYSAGVGIATPFPGARHVCRAMRELLGADQHGVRAGRTGPARIQDPFALRALPQVHGPLIDSLDAAAATVEALVNTASENPLLRPEHSVPYSSGTPSSGTPSSGTESSGTDLSDAGPAPVGLVAHHGGFHLAYLQLAMDGLGLAALRSAQLVLARLSALCEPALTGLPAFLGDGSLAASGVMACEYVAAGALAEIRAAAVPAGLQTAVLSRGVEEDASFASLAATQASRIAVSYRRLLAVELVVAVRAVRMLPPGPALPDGVAAALQICADLPADRVDRDLTADLESAADLLHPLAALVDLR